MKLDYNTIKRGTKTNNIEYNPVHVLYVVSESLQRIQYVAMCSLVMNLFSCDLLVS